MAATHEPTTDTTQLPRTVLAGYQLGELIGRGGMGEVILARDARIGRDVAVKRMRGANPSATSTARFLREARIQARLEHPAIVPVHELGWDAEGQPYFTMKRLAGVTLEELLAEETRPPRQRLLRAFADVCSAIAFAHSRGVIHRDLKPANIVFGGFAEVYVIDWGLARALDEEDAITIPELDSLDGMTQAGALIGTPGFMSPEQIRSAAEVGRPTDIYALGAILFGILAGESLHDRGMIALHTTTEGIDGSPAKRQPGRAIPPELDALCAAALALDPAARPTATALAEGVESYLDGDRDHDRRRALAAQWLAKAREALAADPVRRRAEAVQNAGRALALDPESRDAAQLVTRLMVEPAEQLPVELTAELAAAEAATQRRQSKVAMLSFVAIALFLGTVVLIGLRSGLDALVVAVLTAVMATTAFRLSRRAATTGEMIAVAIGNAALASVLSRAFGSLIVAPAVTCVMAVSLTSYPQLIDRARIVIAILVVSWLAPVVLEATGVLAETWHVVDGAIMSDSRLVRIGGISTTWLLVAANVVTIVVVGLFANALARSRRDAQRQVEIQAWHLRQLLPPVA